MKKRFRNNVAKTSMISQSISEAHSCFKNSMEQLGLDQSSEQTFLDFGIQMAMLCFELKIIQQVFEVKFLGLEISVDLLGKFTLCKVEQDPLVLSIFNRLDELATIQKEENDD